MRAPQKVILGVTTAIGLVVGSAALAWACTAEPMISVAALASPEGVAKAVRDGRATVVSPNSETTVQVVNYADDAPGRVEIRWDSLDGPLLGQANGLSVPVRIPEAAPGVHHLTALFRGTDGKVLSKASTPVTIAGKSLFTKSSAWDSSASNSASRTGTSLVLGAGVLAVGLVMAFGGAALATDRRRSTVCSSSRPASS